MRKGGGSGGRPSSSGGSSTNKQQQQQMMSARVGRPSISRRSSIIFNKSSCSQPRSDPRPITDKAFQVQSLSVVVEYLTTHGFSTSISAKSLPSAKDIREIIEFLLSCYDPGFKIAKLDEDMPFIFKLIGYPFQISKSTLHAAGSPHTWPALLAAITWLVRLLNYKERVLNARSSNMAYDHIARSYQCFMAGDDEACNELENELCCQVEEERLEIEKEIESLASKLEELKAHLHALKTEPSPLAALESKKADLLSDTQKFHAIISKFMSHKEVLERKLIGRKEELQAKEEELSKLTLENEVLKEQVLSQQFSVADVEKLQRESQKIEEELQASINFRQEREKEAWDMEVTIAKKMKELESVIDRCNRNIPRLKNLPSGAQEQTGGSLELKFNPRGETVQDILGTDIKGTVRPQVAALIEAYEKHTQELCQEASNLRIQIRKKEDEAHEKHNEILQLEAKNKKLEAAYKKKKSELEAFIASSIGECEALKAGVEEEEQSLQRQLMEAKERLKQLEAQEQQKIAACEADVKRSVGMLTLAIDEAIKHKEYVASVIARVRDNVEKSEQIVKNALNQRHHTQFETEM